MKILFVCRSNAGRSQMAEAFFNKFSANDKAVSAGTHVEKKKLPDFVVKCMKDLGYDISHKTRRKIIQSVANASDKIIVIMEPKERKLLPDYVKKSGKTILKRNSILTSCLSLVRCIETWNREDFSRLKTEHLSV